jgi:hypothetical protein
MMAFLLADSADSEWLVRFMIIGGFSTLPRRVEDDGAPDSTTEESDDET